MDELLDQAQGQMDTFEKVLAGVPGIKGYKEKEQRRETDKAYRKVLAQRLDDQKARLDNLQAELASSGQLSILDDLERSGKKLQRLSDRMRTASYGYAPLFDLVKVKEAQLDALLTYDKSLFQDVERIKTVIDNMTTMSGLPEQEWQESIRALNTILDDLNTSFGHREEVILQVAETEEPPPAE
jgi:hypothetical protein